MDLIQYWRIVWRRWPLILLLVALVLIVSLLTTRAPAPLYQASMRFAIGIEGTESVNVPSGEGRSDAWLASEYLADDLSQVLQGGNFAGRISQRTGFPVPAGVISATREHRIMTVTITWPDQSQVQAIAEAVAAELKAAPYDYFPQLQGIQAQAVLIDGPGIGTIGPSLTDRLNLPIRLLIALAAGIALAFLWDYVDDTIRGRAEAQALGLRVLGEIPRARRR